VIGGVSTVAAIATLGIKRQAHKAVSNFMRILWLIIWMGELFELESGVFSDRHDSDYRQKRNCEKTSSETMES
jgi:hypothetical protein